MAYDGIQLLCRADTIGDAFVVVGGLNGYAKSANHALACVQFALHMQYDMAKIREVMSSGILSRTCFPFI